MNGNTTLMFTQMIGTLAVILVVAAFIGGSDIISKITSKKAAEFAASDACIGCGQCARLCPPREYPHCGRAKRLSDRIMSSALAARRAPSPSVQSRKREHYHNPDITPEELTQKIIHI